MNRKLKKLIKNPNLFFRDYFYKKFNSTQIVESSSTLTVNEKVVNKVQNPVLTQDFSFLISGSLDSCLSFLRKNFKFEDPKVLFFGYEEQYYQFFYENKEWRYEEIEKNPLSTYRDGYSCFLHSSDVISSNFFKSCLISIKKNKPDLIVPGYFEARNHISQPTVRLRKCGGVFYESIYGLVVKNETIRKIDLYDENYWGALDGSQLLVGLLSFIDLKKIETIRNIKYIYVRKPFGSGFREVNSLDIDQWIISFLHGTKRYVSDSKVENASTLQKSIIYIFNNILNLGFKKKDLAWDTNYSFEKMANDI